MIQKVEAVTQAIEHAVSVSVRRLQARGWRPTGEYVIQNVEPVAETIQDSIAVGIPAAEGGVTPERRSASSDHRQETQSILNLRGDDGRGLGG